MPTSCPHRQHSLIATGVIVAAVLVWSVSTGVRWKTESQVLVREAEDAVSVTAAFILKDDPVCSGGRALEIPPNSGRGWNNEAGGTATYNVTLAQDGQYWLWLRTFWRDGCQNAVYVQVNSGRKIIAGNDAVFNQWHWVKSGPFRFHAGHNRLCLLNHSDGIMLDKWELTRNADYQPQGYGSEISEFFDGFGGCDGGNFGSWNLVSGKWAVTGEAQGNQNGMGAVLMQLSDGEAMAIAEQMELENFTASLLLQAGGKGELGLALGCENEKAQYLLLWTKDGSLDITNAHAGNSELLGKIKRNTGAWSQWEIQYSAGALRIVIDGEVAAEKYPLIMRKGKLGLYTSGAAFSAFDNIRIKRIK